MSDLEFIRLPAARNIVFSRRFHRTQTDTDVDVDVVRVPDPNFRRNLRCSEIRVFLHLPQFLQPLLKMAVNRAGRDTHWPFCLLGSRSNSVQRRVMTHQGLLMVAARNKSELPGVVDLMANFRRLSNREACLPRRGTRRHDILDGGLFSRHTTVLGTWEKNRMSRQTVAGSRMAPPADYRRAVQRPT